MKKRINLVYSSHLSIEENEAFEEHVNKTCGVPVSIHGYPNFNEYSLPEVYNRAIREIDTSEAITVFAHNDLKIKTKDWGKKLLKHFNNKNNQYQIIGVAGSVSLHSHGCWWLTEDGKNINTKDMIGIVNHVNGVGREYESRYSEPFVGVKPVLLVDGLFIAVDTDEIEHTFDESYKGYHMYDLSLCIPNYLDGCNIGVITDIRITHMSVGQTNEQWELNRQQFVEQYKDELPLTVEEP